MPATVRQTVTFTKPQYDWLKAEAERLGISVSDLIRRLIDEGRDRRR
jgi:predicted DNA-binding ribbon-helix-helix protein